MSKSTGHIQRHTLAISLACLLSPAFPAFALAEPDQPPEHPLVVAEQHTETASLRARTGLLTNAYSNTEHAYEALTEVRAMIAAGRYEGIGSHLKEYNGFIRKAVREVTEEDEDAERGLVRALESVARATRRHNEILVGLLDKVPEQARSSIEHSILVSQRGRNTALVRLERIYSREDDAADQSAVVKQVFNPGRGSEMKYGGDRGRSTVVTRGPGASAGRGNGKGGGRP